MMLGQHIFSLLAFESSREDLEKLREGFLSRPSGGEQLYFWAWVLGFLGCVGAAVLIARLMNRKKTTVRRIKRVDYLTVAVDVLGISETDRRTLIRIASRAGLEQPASMLLSPMNLARAVALATKSAKVPHAEETAQRLCKRLFGASLPAAGESKTPTKAG